MVMLNLNTQHVGKIVHMNMDIQGEHRHLQIYGEGATIYEAFGVCMAKLMQDHPCEHDLKVTWVRCRPHRDEWTVIQETVDGYPIDVRWGTNLFEDLFAPVYSYLKEL